MKIVSMLTQDEADKQMEADTYAPVRAPYKVDDRESRYSPENDPAAAGSS